MNHKLLMWVRWLEWLDSHDGRLDRRSKGGNETDGDFLGSIPNPPARAILTVGDLRVLVELIRKHG